MASLRDTQEAIRSMRIRGAAAIGGAACHALGNHVAQTDGGLDEVIAAAHSGAGMLRQARPTAVTLHHGIEAVVRAVQEAHTGDEARQAARRAVSQFKKDMQASQDAVIDAVAHHARDAPVVLTHCHSSTVVDGLIRAHREGSGPEVYCTETRPWRQGAITASLLHKAGVDVTLIVDSAVACVTADRGVQQVIVGADTVAFDGTLFNKIGTRGVALAAKDAGIPFRSAASRFKFAPWRADRVPIEVRDAHEILDGLDVPAGLHALNPVFDATPAKLVTAYLTERGPLGPGSAVKAATEVVLA